MTDATLILKTILKGAEKQRFESIKQHLGLRSDAEVLRYIIKHTPLEEVPNK